MNTKYTLVPRNEFIRERMFSDIKKAIDFELKKLEGDVEFDIAFDDDLNRTIRITKMSGVSDIDASRLRNLVDNLNKRSV